MIRFRIIFLVMVILTLLFILLPLVLGLVLAVFSYHGVCYGFTDGSWPCNWQEYLSDQIFWSSLLELPISIYLLATWLIAVGLWLYKRRSKTPNGLPLCLAVVIPIGGYIGGSCLMSIFPVFIRYFYGLHP
jgi:hypothetical protein